MKPIVIASANGHQFRNGGTETCVERAFRLMTSGVDVLDAVVEGVTIVELDPDETSVGVGGLPNAGGVVELDACCMHGPQRRAGGVAALRGIVPAAAVARRVLLDTPHHLIAGEGALEFARATGFKSRDLLTPKSRALWQEWKTRVDARMVSGPNDVTQVSTGPLARARRLKAGHTIGLEMTREGLIDANHLWGTITCSGVGPQGDVCGVTTTSGLAWKVPGRVGDSPILGAGLYVHQDAGAAGSTGRGEANLYHLSSYSIVSAMRRGASPKDAAMAALREIQMGTIDPALLNRRGRPNFNVKLYVVGANGECAGAALYGGPDVLYAVCTENGGELRVCEALIDEGQEFVD
jgi:N4-(beta-N-acetylglucosaminyl)-L-asparaginase